MNNQAIAPGRRASEKTQSRFQRLWEEAESVAKENLELDKTLDSLVQRVGDEVLQAERALGEAVRQVVHRQLDFAEKKSLLKWQRAELSEWIDEHLTQLMDMGQLDEALQNRLAQRRAQELGIELDKTSDVSAVDQLRQKLYQDTDDEQEELRGSMFGESGEDESDDWFDYDKDEEGDTLASDSDYAADEELAELLRQLHEEFGGGDESRQDRHDETQSATIKRKNKPGFDDAVFKRLFRQTAAALHPDKETDQDMQREKHELMSQLLQARKERDLITILRLHEEYSSAETNLSAEDEQQLEEVLVDYLAQQQERTQDIVLRSQMHEFVFHEFYHKNPATVKRRIKAHIKKIDTRRAGLETFVQHVKTLKSLKELLEERYERYRFDPRWF